MKTTVKNILLTLCATTLLLPVSCRDMLNNELLPGSQYENILQYTHENNSESLFELNYLNDPQNAALSLFFMMTGWRSEKMTLPEGSDIYNGTWGFCNPQKELYDVFVSEEGANGLRLKQTLKSYDRLIAEGYTVKPTDALFGVEGALMWKTRKVNGEVVMKYTTINFCLGALVTAGCVLLAACENNTLDPLSGKYPEPETYALNAVLLQQASKGETARTFTLFVELDGDIYTIRGVVMLDDGSMIRITYTGVLVFEAELPSFSYTLEVTKPYSWTPDGTTFIAVEGSQLNKITVASDGQTVACLEIVTEEDPASLTGEYPLKSVTSLERAVIQGQYLNLAWIGVPLDMVVESCSYYMEGESKMFIREGAIRIADADGVAFGNLPAKGSINITGATHTLVNPDL